MMFFLLIAFFALLVTVILLNYSEGAVKPVKYLPSWYEEAPCQAPSASAEKELEKVTEKGCNPMLQPPSFVPVEDERVPSQASYSNKFNDVIGNETSGIFGKAADPEIFIPSDWYMSATLPTEFDGKYWPKGTIEYDFLYPGGDPERPLRPQWLYSSQILSFSS